MVRSPEITKFSNGNSKSDVAMYNFRVPLIFKYRTIFKLKQLVFFCFVFNNCSVFTFAFCFLLWFLFAFAFLSLCSIVFLFVCSIRSFSPIVFFHSRALKDMICVLFSVFCLNNAFNRSFVLFLFLVDYLF